MCIGYDIPTTSGTSGTPVTPEQKLADLMRADLGTTCSAREIRMFIRANWKRVTAYAHAIHDANPNTIGD